MAEFPDDIRKVARDIMDNACLGEHWANNGVDAALRQDIAIALMAERQRCADLAKFVSEIKPGSKIGRDLGEDGQRIMAETGAWLLTEILRGVTPPLRLEVVSAIEFALSGAKRH